MEAFSSFFAILKAMSEWGLVGLIVVIYWLDRKDMLKEREEHRKEIAGIMDRYQADMIAQRTMYENNVKLVEAYELLAKDLKDVIILNTQAFTRLDDGIRSNQFCPQVRLEKLSPGKVEGGGS